MKYYVIEGQPNGSYNASTKARADVEQILNKLSYEPLYVNSKNGVQKNKLMKWKQFLTYKANLKKWNQSFQKLNKGDIVLVQYPIINTVYNLGKVIQKYKENGVIFIALIHDMDSLRYSAEEQGKMLYDRVSYDDHYLLNEFNYIICHNESMKNELCKNGIFSDKIFILKIFDYLVQNDIRKIERNKNNPIVIAGNLSPKKAKYLSKLNTLDVSFNLFGVGYDEKFGGKNIFYKGKYLPSELLNYLEGSFGLVWDGISIDTCIGGFGKYLKYNNPHKVSLYLTAGLPIIIWREAALAKFVEKNKVGICVGSLQEIKQKIEKLTDDDYQNMLNNCQKISERIRNGQYLIDVITKIEKNI